MVVILGIIVKGSTKYTFYRKMYKIKKMMNTYQLIICKFLNSSSLSLISPRYDAIRYLRE